MEVKLFLQKKLDYFDLEIDLSCPGGQILALVGPSGSGKSTILRTMAGLEKPDRGRMILGQQQFFDSQQDIWLPTRKRRCGYLFQDYGLFPHLRIRDNVAFACRRPGLADQLMKKLGICHLAERKPHQLSGGERQRAALAQNLAFEPQLLLLDEPFSALDIDTRKHLQNFLLELKKTVDIPIILVTHDLNEATRLGDQAIAVVQGRKSPQWLERVACFYDSPAKTPATNTAAAIAVPV